VAARTREIATLRALGFGSSPVILSVMFESLVLALIGGIFTLRRTSRRFETGWERLMRRVRSRLGRVMLVALGSQIGMLIVLAGLVSTFACWVGASEWVLGVNFLFAVTWTEVLDITEKLFEAADEFAPE